MKTVNQQRLSERNMVKKVFDGSQGSAGSRMIASSLKLKNITMGRYKVSRLMEDQGWSADSLASTNISLAVVNCLTSLTYLIGSSIRSSLIKFGQVILLTSGQAIDGLIWRWCWTYTNAVSLAGQCQIRPTATWQLKL